MFWEIFYDLCSKNDTTPNPVCKELGFSNATATHWKNGTCPKGDALCLIADYFHCSVDYLLGREEQPKVSVTAQEQARLSDDEEKLLEIYRGLTETQKALVLDRAQGFSDLNEAEAKKDDVG